MGAITWWARSRLRTKIFLAFSTLVVAVLIATLGFTQYVVSRDAQRTLRRELLTTGELFDALLTERATRLRTNSVLLSSDFALKRVIATHLEPTTYDPDTLASAALSYHDRIDVDLLWITDENGAVLVSSAKAGLPSAGNPANASGHASANIAPLSTAVETQETTTAIATVDGNLYQLAVVPVLAPDVIGFLVLGQAIDNAFARRLREATGADVSFLSERAVFASSWPPGNRDRFVPAGALRSQVLKRGRSRETTLLTAGGGRFLALALPVTASLQAPLFALIQGSYDVALAPLHNLQLRIVAVGLAALVSALLIGIGLASGITSPLQNLVAGMQQVLKGNLRFRSRLERQDEIGFLSRSFNDMVAGLEDRERIRDTFGRFVSHEVAEAMLSGQVPLQGQRRDVSILFQDIRGFTTLSESLDPPALLALLNRFFTQVVAAVEAEGGVVKQFLGDGVMALFGAPQAYSDHAQRAARAALDIVARLSALNEVLRQQGWAPLEIGIGIHTGNVVAGLIGPDNRIEYGVVGDAVNVASRIESLTKDMSATVLVSKDVASHLGPRFILGRSAALPVKGRKRVVDVVEVIGHEAEAPQAHRPGGSACSPLHLTALPEREPGYLSSQV